MRLVAIALLAALAACATSGPAPDPATAPSPFPVARGTAPAPPRTTPNHAAPPEGPAAAGLDFGQWRGADPASYAPAFQTRVRQRFAGRNGAEIRADLAANGFACEDGPRLDCRIEIMERQCAYDWYVVLERSEPAPIAGFEVMCLGAR